MNFVIVFSCYERLLIAEPCEQGRNTRFSKKLAALSQKGNSTAPEE
jgi:hypothetical protein